MTTDTKVSELPELPEPDWKAKGGVSEGVYSAAQVRDFGTSCYQAALARQEADKTKAAIWIEFSENGNIRFWTSDQDRAIEESFCHARSLTAYYAAPPAQAVDLLRRAVPFLNDEAAKYDDDGSNEPLELAREIEALIDQQAGGAK